MVLIPEVRADKNGKLVTRNIRQDKPVPSSKRQVPAPKVFNEQSNKLAEELGSEIDMRANASAVMKSARRLPDDTAKALLDAKKYAVPHGAFSGILVTALLEEATPEHLENIALIYSDDQYYNIWKDDGDNHAYRIISEDIKGLSHYPQLNGSTNYYRADEDTQRKAIALTSILTEAGKRDMVAIVEDSDGKQGAVLKDDRLAQFAIDNRGDLRALVTLVSERGCDVDVLIEGMNTTAPLRSGAL